MNRIAIYFLRKFCNDPLVMTSLMAKYQNPDRGSAGASLPPSREAFGRIFLQIQINIWPDPVGQDRYRVERKFRTEQTKSILG